MLKMASESFTDVVVGFRPFSQNFPLGQRPLSFVFAVLFNHTFSSCSDRLFSYFVQFGGDSHCLNFVTFLDTALNSCFG